MPSGRMFFWFSWDFYKSFRNLVIQNTTIIFFILPAPYISESCIKIKINLNFYFCTSLWCLKRFYEGLYKRGVKKKLIWFFFFVRDFVKKGQNARTLFFNGLFHFFIRLKKIKYRKQKCNPYKRRKRKFNPYNNVRP